MKVSLSGTIDWSLVITPLILLVFGISVIYSLSHGAPRNIAINQSIYAVIGIAAMVVLTFTDYRTWKSLAPTLYILGIIFLASVFLFGSKTFGATRWIDFGFFQFQPSELMKLILAITLARFLSDNKKIGIKQLMIAGAIILFPVGMILMQPDLGSASVLLFISLVLLLLSGMPRALIIGGVIISLIAIPVGYQFLAPYQKERLKVFVDPEADPSGSGYNVVQSKIAIGSGGVWGRGLGQGSQSQLNFLPVAHTDFIFAGVAEATGFIGSVALLGLLGFIVVRAVVIARLSQDQFGMYLAMGIASLYLYQTFVNSGGNLGIVPVTGIPLPFVSFGGTATIVTLSGIGILQSIYLRHKKIRFA